MLKNTITCTKCGNKVRYYRFCLNSKCKECGQKKSTPIGTILGGIVAAVLGG